MSVLETLQVGLVVDFTTFATAQFNTYKSVKVLAILDSDSAMMMGLDAPSMHAKIYPTLPAGSINDYRKYQYIRIQHPNGQTECIGVPWIVPASLIVKQSSTITVVFENVGPTDVDKIRQMSLLNGYDPKITIE